MADEDYELMPHKEIIELKDELKRLKKEPSVGKTLQNSIEELSQKIDHLIDLFREAGKGAEEGAEEEKSIAQKITPLFDKVDSMMDQNEKIATGMVALADLVKEMKSTFEKGAPLPLAPARPKVPGAPPAAPGGTLPPLGMPPPGMGPPGMPPPSPAPFPKPTAPLGMPPPGMGPPGMPPPAAPPPKKKGLFGR